MAEQPPATLSTALRRRYTIQRELGRGGTAFVFLAHDLKHDRPVAIKVLRPEIAMALGAERFLREIRLAAKLQHPHILPLYDSGEAGGLLYYVMPCVEGQSLRQHLVEGGRLPLDDALRITNEVCDALNYAHRQDIVHRDIKPENILLSQDHALVVDFGLARAIRAAAGDRTADAGIGDGSPGGSSSYGDTVTDTGIAVGTPAYMSPEQADGTLLIDGRSDLYSLGCVLYEMLVGQPPFTGPTVQAVLARHAHDPVPPIGTVGGAAVPEQIERAVIKALAKSPDSRFRTAAQFAQAIAAPHAAASRRRFITTGRTYLLAGAVLLVAAAGWFAVQAWKPDPPPIRRIAVLPLDNLTGDSAQNILVGGMHEALIDELGQIEAVTVISRMSVLRYGMADRPPVRDIARQLSVDAVVEGSVQRSGDSVRVDVQLIDGRTGRRLWARAYVRDMRDVLRLYGELATDVTRQIRRAVTPLEQGRLASARQVDPDVYVLSLKGTYGCLLWTEEGFRRGLQLLRQAVDGDPTYAPAYVGLARCYSDQSFFGYTPATDANPLAKAAIARALELDSTSGDAHAMLGWMRFVADLDFDAPDHEYRRALQLSPGNAQIRSDYGDYLALAGRFEDAFAQKKQAIALDPLSANTSVGLGWAYFKAHRYDESIAQLDRALELEPGHRFAHMELAWNYSEKDMHQAAVAHCDSALGQPRELVILQSCGWVYGRAGHRPQALEMLRQLTATSSRHWLDPFYPSMVYLGLGDRDRAIELLREAARQQAQSLVFLKVDPWLDPLRSDPRFQSLLRELGIRS